LKSKICTWPTLGPKWLLREPFWPKIATCFITNGQMENGFIFFITRGMVIFAHHVPSAEMCVNNIVWLVHDFHKLCSTKLLLEMTFKPKKDLLCVVGCGTHYFLGFFFIIHSCNQECSSSLCLNSKALLNTARLNFGLLCGCLIWALRSM